jgi:hypothetical protein
MYTIKVYIALVEHLYGGKKMQQENNKSESIQMERNQLYYNIEQVDNSIY